MGRRMVRRFQRLDAPSATVAEQAGIDEAQAIAAFVRSEGVNLGS